jgi:hypothetical protein
LVAWGQDGSGHAEHECVLHIFSAYEGGSHARHKAITRPYSAHRLHL